MAERPGGDHALAPGRVTGMHVKSRQVTGMQMTRTQTPRTQIVQITAVSEIGDAGLLYQPTIPDCGLKRPSQDGR